MSALVDQRVPYARRIFCNRNLRLDSVKFIGFDMDYTLALYTEQMEHLQAEMVLERLVESYGYSPDVLKLTYDPAFAIRGLAVDMVHGNVFKMDAHRFVGRVWHGDAPLDKALRRETYTNRKIAPQDPNFRMVDTLFALPEISLFCQLVHSYDSQPEGAFRPPYVRLWHDLREAMDSLHRDGTLKARITQDLPRYIAKDPELAETLHRFRSAGKHLFIMTNSHAPYTREVMSYLLDGAYPGYQSWEDYFDFVITAARKPVFFNCDEPFVEVLEDGSHAEEPATSLKRGRLYHGGNFQELTRLTGMIGDEVLYVGDHIYGDILRSKRDTSWRTAMIIPEMERELVQVRAHADALDRLGALEEERFQLNLERTARALDGDRDRKLVEEARALNREIAQLERQIADAFNPYWGMLFRDRSELSAFGEQVEDYACVYSSRVSNFRLYSPVWYFRSPRDRMAHELQR